MEPTDGVVRVFRDVIVRRESDEEWIAISREAAVVGETLVLDVDEGEERQRFTVCVIESRPVIVDGDMRHRIRLQTNELPPVLFEQQVRRG
jgi:hypothetical protein